MPWRGKKSVEYWGLPYVLWRVGRWGLQQGAHFSLLISGARRQREKKTSEDELCSNYTALECSENVRSRMIRISTDWIQCEYCIRTVVVFLGGGSSNAASHLNGSICRRALIRYTLTLLLHISGTTDFYSSRFISTSHSFLRTNLSHYLHI
jgi:hypothetical protein